MSDFKMIFATLYGCWKPYLRFVFGIFCFVLTIILYRLYLKESVTSVKVSSIAFFCCILIGIGIYSVIVSISEISKIPESSSYAEVIKDEI